MKHRAVEDVAHLPTTGFGSTSPVWWGTLGFVALEGMGFALAGGAYLYLWQVNPKWPIGPQPSAWAATAMLVLLLVSIWPNVMAERQARALRLREVQFWLVVMCVIGFATLAIRAWEFWELNIRWDANAYGSITWFVLGMHTVHLITDLGDTVVLAALMFTRHATERRFSDVSDNAFYWYFVVGSWVPLYALLYGVPRL